MKRPEFHIYCNDVLECTVYFDIAEANRALDTLVSLSHAAHKPKLSRVDFLKKEDWHIKLVG